MKSILQTSLIAAAIIAAPMVAEAAGFCGKKKHGKHNMRGYGNPYTMWQPGPMYYGPYGNYYPMPPQYYSYVPQTPYPIQPQFIRVKPR